MLWVTGIFYISALMFKQGRGLLTVAIILQFCHNVAYGQNNDLKSAAIAGQILSARGEVIIRFVRPASISIEELSEKLSIDDVRKDTVEAYAGSAAFEYFQKLHIPYEIIPAPSLNKKIFSTKKADSNWHNHYPAYSEYLDLMASFENDHPELCSLVDFGTTAAGHKLLALKITDHPDAHENEPAVLYTSTMHGDEPLGYVLMLRLAEYLLSNYQSDPYVRKLTDQAEIWINPLFNPDGAYFMSDTSIEGAIRGNRIHPDLNRDFPDIRYAEVDNSQRQVETRAMMDFMEEIHPVLAANFHGGAEVVNYPWDTWYSPHADVAWYRQISRAYADSAQKYGPSGYMTFLDNGITNGNDWYTVFGGRQDYVNYFLHGREVTIELSDDKIPAENDLDAYWNYNRQSLLHYLGQSFTGFTGMITDSLTGLPLRAQVRIRRHDVDNSYVFSKTEDGVYYRLTTEGDYNIAFTAPGYRNKYTSITVSPGTLKQQDIQLSNRFEQELYPNPFSEFLYLFAPYPGYNLKLEFVDLWGRKVKVISQPVFIAGQQQVNVEDLAPGYYIIHVTYNKQYWNLVGIRNDR